MAGTVVGCVTHATRPFAIGIFTAGAILDRNQICKASNHGLRTIGPPPPSGAIGGLMRSTVVVGCGREHLPGVAVAHHCFGNTE